jgi:hypothetical protein
MLLPAPWHSRKLIAAPSRAHEEKSPFRVCMDHEFAWERLKNNEDDAERARPVREPA